MSTTASLRENLIRGGVTNDTIALLSNIHPEYPRDETAAPAVASQPEPAKAHGPLQATTRPPPKTHHYHGRDQWTAGVDQVDDDDESLVREASADNVSRENSQRYHAERVGTRTLSLSNLAEGTCHTDITAVVRGGQLLDVFLKRKDKSASISFLHADDARAFYEHVRKHDLYIKQRRVEVSWNDRQFKLPGHIAHKINSGATRNLVIRRCGRQLTEDEIREDLEHIHNLVVVRVEFILDNCYISTNSVACASFARTCMMSRLKYKGSRIEFDADECAQSLDRLAGPKRNTRPNTVTAGVPSTTSTMANRFQLLDFDDDEY